MQHTVLQSARYQFDLVFFLTREDKKKKQKQEGPESEEKVDVSPSGPAADQGSKGGGGGPTQQPLKRGQRVREQRDDNTFCSKSPQRK